MRRFGSCRVGLGALDPPYKNASRQAGGYVSEHGMVYANVVPTASELEYNSPSARHSGLMGHCTEKNRCRSIFSLIARGKGIIFVDSETWAVRLA